jgi:outer membrane immunogenic protein
MPGEIAPMNRIFHNLSISASQCSAYQRSRVGDKQMKRLLIGMMSATALAGGAGMAIAADMAPYYRAPVPAPVFYSWTGFYVGGNAGGAWSSNNALWTPLPSSSAFGVFPIAGDTGGSSAIGGFQAGYNWQFAPTWVAGIEGDWSWANTGSSINQQWATNPAAVAVPGSSTSMSSTLDWVSSLRARLGYLVLPNLMAYGTAGGAWGKVDYAASNSGGVVPYATSTAFSSTQGGWVAGGGLEWMITPNWLLRGEYLYYSLNSSPSVVAASPTAPGFPSGYSWSNTNVSVARAALSYKF